MNILEQYKLYRKDRLRERMLPIFDDYFRGLTGTPIREWQKDKRQELQSMEYRMWFEGKQEKLEWFYKQYMINVADHYTLSYRDNIFWKVVNKDSVKLHFPLGGMISDAMANLLFHKAPEMTIEAKSESETELLTEILVNTLQENGFDELLQKGGQLESYSGTLACRVIIDTNFSEYPIIKFHPASEFELVEEYGRAKEIIFNDIYTYNKKKYVLKSYYGKGYIRYLMFDERDKEVPLSTIPETSQLKDIFLVDKSGEPLKILLAVYKVNRPCDNEFINSLYGESDYSSLMDTFQAIDETYSAIIDRVRKGHILTAVSEDLTTIDEKTGRVKRLDDYQLKTITLNSSPDPSLKSVYDRTIPNIDISGLYESLQQMLRNALSRVGLSPNTVIENLGGANSSAQALEIREGVSERTRETKIRLWEKFLKDISRLIFIFYSMQIADVYLKDDKQIAYKVDDDGSEYEYKCVFPPYKPEDWKERLPTLKEALEAGLIDRENALKQLWKDDYTDEEIEQMKDEIEGIIPINKTEENNG